MSNANLDNTPQEYQNQKKRRSRQQWDIIEIDNRKGTATTQNKNPNQTMKVN